VRGIRVLETVAPAPGPIGVTEVAAATGLDKGTTSRLLAILRELGYVRQSLTDRQYELGARCLWLAQGYSDSRAELVRRAAPELALLRDATGETVHLAVLEGRSVVSVAQEQPDRELRVHAAVGTRLPIDRTATGRAILAAMSAPERDLLVSQLVEDARTHGQEPALDGLEADVAGARLRGWVAVDLHDEILRVAAAVLDAQERPIAAITVSGPGNRMTARLDQVGAEVSAAARRVSTGATG
jgi:DNA-binding IclR family transcriptional regulator